MSTFESDKGRALLAFLVIESDRPHSRENLAALLWPDDTRKAGRQNLRQALYSLRQIFDQEDAEPPFLMTSRQDVQFNLASDFWLDVRDFSELLDVSYAHNHRSIDACDACHERLRNAVTLYRGEFLEGFSLPDALAFDEWHRFQADGLRNRLLETLTNLAVYHDRRREYEMASQYYRRSIEIDSLNESAYRGLIRALTLSGHQESALRQYEHLCSILAAELNAEPEAETVALVERIRQGGLQPRLLDSENPYKGLNAFGEEDAADFFGRETAVEEIAALVADKPIVCVVGPSGCGKSSIIQAGLLPRLVPQPSGNANRSGIRDASVRWSHVYLRPGPEPFVSLAEALNSQTHNPAWVDDLAAGLHSGSQSLPEAATVAMSKSSSTAPHRPEDGGKTNLLIVIDQFEELFTLCRDPDTQQRFIDMLADTIKRANAESLSVVILLTMRGDFLGEALSYRPLADILQRSLYLLKPMDRDEMRAAITEPARSRGIIFAPGLVQRLIDDAGLEVGNLPLLQFALTLLWEKQDRGELTHAAYQNLGGVVGALAGYADRVYQNLSQPDQARARRALLRMVHPGEGVPDTRRLTLRREFDDQDWMLVRKLADERLVVTSRGAADAETAEIAHEALIRNWGLMRTWLDKDRIFRSWQLRLQAALHQWDVSERHDSALLRGIPLAEAENWLEERAEDLNANERAFIEAGIEYRTREERDAEAAREQELVKAQTLAEMESQRAETEARSNRRLRVLSLILGAALILGTVAIIIAMQQGRAAIAAARLAEQQRRLALTRQLSAQAVNLQDNDLDLALLLAAESERMSDSANDRSDLLLQLDYSPLAFTTLHGETAPIRNIALNGDDPNTLISSADGRVMLWDLAARQPITTVMEMGSETFAGLSPDGRRAATTDGASLTLWELPSGRQIGQPLTEHPDTIDFFIFSMDGSRLVTGSVDGTLLLRDASDGHVLKSYEYDGSGGMVLGEGGRNLAMYDDFDGQIGVEIWDMEQGQRVAGPIFGHDGSVESISMSHDGSLLATAGADQTVRLWDGLTGEPLGEPLRGHTGRVLTADFSPDNRTLASGSTDNTIILWDVATGERLGPPLTGHGNWVRDVMFSPDGKSLITADAGGEIMVWDVSQRSILRGHDNRVRGLALSADESKLLTGGFDARADVWNLTTGEQLEEWTDVHQAAIVTAVTSPDRKWIATGDVDGYVQLWDAHTMEPVRSAMRSAHPSFVISLAFSPDSRTLATGDLDGFINLWDVESGQAIVPPIQAHDAWVLALAFSPDGLTLASGGANDSLVKLWSVDELRSSDDSTKQPSFIPLEGHTNWVTCLVFSPDGVTLISGSSDQTIRFWDVAAGTASARPPLDNRTQVWSALWYPPDAGRTLMTLGVDGSVIWWDVETGVPLGPPLRTYRETESMTMNSDGSAIYIGAVDPIAQVWRVQRPDWQNEFCQIANRNLTPEEWQKYLGDEPYHETCMATGAEGVR